MKWYWAMLVTLAIMIVVGMLPGNAAANAAMLVSAISAIAIAAHSRSWGWGIFVLFLWPIGFPCYLIAGRTESGVDSCDDPVSTGAPRAPQSQSPASRLGRLDWGDRNWPK